VPQRSFDTRCAQHEPWPTGDVTATRSHTPASAHAQVRSQDDAAVESQQQVLAVRVDGFESPPVELRGVDRRLSARMRGLDLDALADERLQPASGAMDRGAFGHQLLTVACWIGPA